MVTAAARHYQVFPIFADRIQRQPGAMLPNKSLPLAERLAPVPLFFRATAHRRWSRR